MLNREVKFMTAKGLETTTTEFVNENSVNLAKWLSVTLRSKWLFLQVLLKSVNLRILACFEQGVF